jgi:hypothetical protein
MAGFDNNLMHPAFLLPGQRFKVVDSGLHNADPAAGTHVYEHGVTSPDGRVEVRCTNPLTGDPFYLFLGPDSLVRTVS